MKPWMWIVGAVLLIGFIVLLSPMIALAALAVLITGIVALVKGTPTWLGLRSRKAALALTSVAAVVFMIAGTITSVTNRPDDASRTDAAPAATAEPAPLVETAKAPSPAPAPPADETWRNDATLQADSRTALEALATLEIKGRAPKTGYSRDAFGPAWKDVDGNGCDTRDDILRRDLTAMTTTDRCTVSGGTLGDPYTATSITFERGPETSSVVQIDHLVALGDAWQKGAQQLTEETRQPFANDPLNLLAVSGRANLQKGDGDAATWLPHNKAFRCEYVARQVSVKAAYGLWVTQAEHDAIAGLLEACPGQRSYVSLFAPPPVAPVEEAPPADVPAAPAQPAPAQPAPEAPVSVHYANCTAVRAAGAAPLYDGQPGYSRKLDRDGDGVACE
ncbi:GmrSD restriction endonuclease domain-containing protein [Microbacterium ulmi]|uniref:GmrSD restriction endonuclease domain-containing protein n=1 Tax=Microbacterium ulmi TaxID=179095 RepID=UPI00325A4FA4